MKIPFRVVRSSYEENTPENGRPERIVIAHALGKARAAVLPRSLSGKKREFVLGADTIVFFRGKILGKPKTLREAKKILRKMSGHTHRVYSGIALIDRRTGKARVSFDKTAVKFLRLSEEKIDDYLARTHPLDKAGAYAIQEKPVIVEHFRGSYSNIVGLPLEKFQVLIRQALEDEYAI